LRALAHEPEDRFQNMADLGKAPDDLATELGARAGTEEIAAYVGDLCGDQGRRRREALRSAIRDAESKSSVSKLAAHNPSLGAISVTMEPEELPEISVSAQKSGTESAFTSSPPVPTEWPRWARLAGSAALFVT